MDVSFMVHGSWFMVHGSLHQLEGYFESLAPQGFQNNPFL